MTTTAATTQEHQMTAMPATEDYEPLPDQPSTALGARGRLPLALEHYAEIPLYVNLKPRMGYNARRGTLMAVSGPVGVGKTTAVAQVLRDFETRPVWVQMTTNLSARGHMADIWYALTHTTAIGDLRQTRDDIISYLCDHRVALAMDDAHFITASGLRTLVTIWNEVHIIQGRGVPMFLVGNGLLRKLATVPEVLSRVGTKWEATPLHGDDLLAALAVIEPRLAAADTDMLFDIDRRYLKGELRQWNEFVEAVQGQRHDPAKPVSASEASRALNLLGFITPSS